MACLAVFAAALVGSPVAAADSGTPVAAGVVDVPINVDYWPFH